VNSVKINTVMVEQLGIETIAGGCWHNSIVNCRATGSNCWMTLGSSLQLLTNNVIATKLPAGSR